MLVFNGKEHEYLNCNITEYVPNGSLKNTWTVNGVIKSWKMLQMQLVAHALSQLHVYNKDSTSFLNDCHVTIFISNFWQDILPSCRREASL